MFARWLMANPKVAIFDEPTRGVDVGAKAEIYGLMVALLAQLTVPSGLRVAGAATTAAAPTAATLYREAMATTKDWKVHYVSTSTAAKVPFSESGDAGPASGIQAIDIGREPRSTRRR